MATPKNSCLDVETTTSAVFKISQYSDRGTDPLCNSREPRRENRIKKHSKNKRKLFQTNT